MSMDNIEIEVTETHRNELNLATTQLCERVSKKLEEFEANYIEFYWYLWEHDSGNTSS